jgi:hypothetical protein
MLAKPKLREGGSRWSEPDWRLRRQSAASTTKIDNIFAGEAPPDLIIQSAMKLRALLVLAAANCLHLLQSRSSPQRTLQTSSITLSRAP